MGEAYALGEYERIWGLDTCLFSLCSARTVQVSVSL
jgi:hypothetical protein